MPAARAANMACWWLTPRSNGFTGSAFACAKPSTPHALMLLGRYGLLAFSIKEILICQAGKLSYLVCMHSSSDQAPHKGHCTPPGLLRERSDECLGSTPLTRSAEVFGPHLTELQIPSYILV